jgi:hypothetical protein
MATSARLFTSVPHEEGARLVALAAEQGVSAPRLLANLVRKAVRETPDAKIERLRLSALKDKAPAEKYTVRLTSADGARLEERAQRRGVTSSGYVAHLLRAHLRANPPMPYAEFQEIKRVVNELSGIRAELSRLTEGVPGFEIEEGLKLSVLRLLPALKGIREQIQSAHISNSQSWHAPDAE